MKKLNKNERKAAKRIIEEVLGNDVYGFTFGFDDCDPLARLVVEMIKTWEDQKEDICTRKFSNLGITDVCYNEEMQDLTAYAYGVYVNYFNFAQDKYDKDAYIYSITTTLGLDQFEFNTNAIDFLAIMVLKKFFSYNSKNFLETSDAPSCSEYSVHYRPTHAKLAQKIYSELETEDQTKENEIETSALVVYEPEVEEVEVQTELEIKTSEYENAEKEVKKVRELKKQLGIAYDTVKAQRNETEMLEKIDDAYDYLVGVENEYFEKAQTLKAEVAEMENSKINCECTNNEVEFDIENAIDAEFSESANDIGTGYEQNYDCRFYSVSEEFNYGKAKNSFGEKLVRYTFESFEKAFAYGAKFYNNPKIAGFIITYEDEVDELATIAFHGIADNFYWNNTEVHKLIRKYLPQIIMPEGRYAANNSSEMLDKLFNSLP